MDGHCLFHNCGAVYDYAMGTGTPRSAIFSGLCLEAHLPVPVFEWAVIAVCTANWLIGIWALFLIAYVSPMGDILTPPGSIGGSEPSSFASE